jgi:tRNA-specific adenosine deaminase 3
MCRVIKDNVEGQDAIDLQHLRRFAKPKYLPPHVLGERDLIKELYSVPRTWESGLPTVMQGQTPSWEWTTPARKRTDTRSPTLYLLVCPTHVIGLPELHDLLKQHTPFCSSADSWQYPLEIKEITVPRLAPTSPEQAHEWSDKYWPTFYRKTNPFGAHPATIIKAEEELQHPESNNVTLPTMMDLADEAGAATEKLGYGVRTGCVIVERVDNQTEIVAVAGDARGKPLPSMGGTGATIEDAEKDDEEDGVKGSKRGSGGGAFAKKTARKKRKKQEEKLAKKAEENACCSGNVMCHAVMRAIGMVGRKRLRVASQPTASRAEKAEKGFVNAGLAHDEKARDAFFLDLPITPLEQKYFERDNLKPDGYLCLKLEIFLTHEPCMMCSMALVHSRVGRVIFKHRMPETGGLTAEMNSNDSGPVGLGYGLCWRKELNWQFMCWEWTAAHRPGSMRVQDQISTRRDSAYHSSNGRQNGNKDSDENPGDPGSSSAYERSYDVDEDANPGITPSLTRVHV